MLIHVESCWIIQPPGQTQWRSAFKWAKRFRLGTMQCHSAPAAWTTLNVEKRPRGQWKCLKISQRMSKMALPLGHKQDRLLDSEIFRVYTCISKFLNSKRAYLMIASKQNSDLWTNVSIGFLWQSTRGFPDCVQPAVRIRMANKYGAQEASRCRWKLGCSSGSCKLFTVSCWQELQRTAACLVDSTGAFCDHEVCWQSWRFREASRLSTKLLCKWQECN